MVNCLEIGADLRMAQLMPLPLTVSCFSKILVGFTFLAGTSPPLGSPGKRAVKRVCVMLCIVSKQGQANDIHLSSYPLKQYPLGEV